MRAKMSRSSRGWRLPGLPWRTIDEESLLSTEPTFEPPMERERPFAKYSLGAQGTGFTLLQTAQYSPRDRGYPIFLTNPDDPSDSEGE
jgi:hypothetical protein